MVLKPSCRFPAMRGCDVRGVRSLFAERRNYAIPDFEEGTPIPTLCGNTGHPLVRQIEDIKCRNIVLPNIQRPFAGWLRRCAACSDSRYRANPVGIVIQWETGAVVLPKQVGTCESGRSSIVASYPGNTYGAGGATTVKIKAESRGFGDRTRRTVSENATQLGFDAHEFEEQVTGMFAVPCYLRQFRYREANHGG